MPPHDARTPTELSTWLACRRASALDAARAQGQIAGPSGFDPTRDLLRERGERHEARYVDELRGRGGEVVELRGRGVDAVVAAMARGVSAIVQARLDGDGWTGVADALVRVEGPASRWGPWSYEVHDTKLARETKVGSIVQLAVYSELLAMLQGVRPERFWVIAPGEPLRREPWRLNDCAAYVRAAMRRFERDAQAEALVRLDASAPEPCTHCSVCRWWKDCDRVRHDEDHLSLVAGISLAQRVELRRQGVATTDALARMTELPAAPLRGSRDGYQLLHRQAAVLVRGRERGTAEIELLPVDASFGLSSLPAPSHGDLFLDLEADPFVEPAGREYLFGRSWVEGEGAAAADRYAASWATDDGAEKRAFEQTMDVIMQRLAEHPDMHVYHFGIYERGALARLVGRHATRASEFDALLRAGVLVDLHRVVKRTMLASVERYSLKELERFFGFERKLPLEDARRAMRGLERALELGMADAIDDDVRRDLESYNRDDCVSTRALRDWLEALRTRIEAERGEPLPRPTPAEGAAPETIAEAEAEVVRVQGLLREGVPEDGERTAEQQARWLMAHLLEFHRRESKAEFWEKFRLGELDEDERLRERAGLAGLVAEGEPQTYRQSWLLRYRFPVQDTTLRVGDPLLPSAARSFGTVHAIDPVARELTVKLGKASWTAGEHPEWLFTWKHHDPKPKPGALLELGKALASGQTAGWDAAVALLLRAPPRLTEGVPWRLPGEAGQAQAKRVVLALDRSVLAVQGPPGTGKTHTGAEMIVALVRAGKRVGVTALGHSVIRNLLDRVIEAGEGGVAVGAKVNEADEDAGALREIEEYADAREQIRSGAVQVLGGTAWLWAREQFEDAVDVLFVDEAGQLSLADVLAVAGAAKSLVLLGDPQQLEQPRKAKHPDGTAVSALGWMIGDRATIDPAQGIFLEETWRMPPSICAFTSEMFYDGRLRGRHGLERRRLVGAGELDGAGLWWVPVEHEGRSVESPEEVDAVEAIVVRLLGGARWVDMNGEERGITGKDVMVIAPYNAQVAAIAQRLRGTGVRVGTVDKFQGQEAEVVVYSMTSSSIGDAPRGMGFLFDRHRLNVATSRARVRAVVVGASATFAAECAEPRQVPLANAVSALLEWALPRAGPT